MTEPGIWPDALNKFSQLTPWVQAVALVCASLTVLGVAYFFKETVKALIPRRGSDKAAK